MLAVTQLHDPAPLGFYALLLAFVLLCKRNWVWLLIVGLAVPGGMLINVMMKLAFQRARPAFDDPILSLMTYSFPSGHVVGATLFYGVLAALLVTSTQAWRSRLAIALAAVAIVALVAASRMVLGVHYLSDVMAGFAEAVAWLTLCLVGVHTYFRHRTEK